MVDPIKQMVRKPSCGAWQDFAQRVRVGAIVALLMILISGVVEWLG